jgi:polyphosphate kinase 2
MVTASSREAGMAELTDEVYDRELRRMQTELVDLQAAVREQGLRVAILMEGRDTAGKGGTISRITKDLNPRAYRVVALGVPTEREKGQWYFQRYVSQLPAAGEIVLFDRSWYNRAGVERVMGFATEEEVEEFLRSAPDLERMLVRSGLILVKYWLEVSAEKQEKRFRERAEDPTKRWKLSPIDLKARDHYDDYTRARDDMFARTDIPEAPWWAVDADSQKRARLNVIAHLLELLPYRREDAQPDLPKRKRKGHAAPIPDGVRVVPERY